MLSNERGTLYVVATPIGNLADISQRARQTLAEVDLVAAEDTRHSGRLLAALGINSPMLALHEHNETALLGQIMQRLDGGQCIALISDAGTPLISDPGFALVRELRRQGYAVVPIPGANAAITALSAAGLATDRFLFLGFPPRTGPARRRLFEQLATETATLVFYESCHRLQDCLRDMQLGFGPQRRAILARELTKLHETFIDAPLAQLVERVSEDADQRRGEMVLLLEGNTDQPADPKAQDAERVLKILLQELPLKQAASLASGITGLRRNDLYQLGLEQKTEDRGQRTEDGRQKTDFCVAARQIK
ncbi:MAG: 16S rRNA (cytidine(1402)-2'-O)-methyltransferase [Gammaproteobacteria bacterium SHHR-1]|uniref:16S rRNA (cytidine(1402)-2'-O)-methyltransferase n=1 Tax=Magnetovirga frankeli TaxID=947516 RepID=UPI001293FE13|nr:16S rRNA (cytidine(1402)-2'-O)-methyltransferase [gamma proteobacterium SS-5]